MKPSRYLIPLIGVGTLWLSACSPHDEEAPHPPVEPQTFAARIAPVEFSAQRNVLRLTGDVEAPEQVEVAPLLMGTLATVTVDIGDAVEAGQILATLDAPEWTARVDAAEAALAQIERDLARESNLLTQGASTTERVSNLEDARRRAAAGLREAEIQRSHTTITAPFSGLVSQRHLDPGTVVQPGLPLLALQRTGPLEVRLAVPNSLSIPPAGTDIEIEAANGMVRGKILRVSTAVEASSRSRETYLQLPASAALVSGERVTVRWPLAATDQLSIPTEALRVVGGLTQVFTEEEGIAQLRLVRVGPERGERTLIHAGLAPEDRVVLAPPSALRHGDILEILP